MSAEISQFCPNQQVRDIESNWLICNLTTIPVEKLTNTTKAIISYLLFYFIILLVLLKTWLT